MRVKDKRKRLSLIIVSMKIKQPNGVPSFIKIIVVWFCQVQRTTGKYLAKKKEEVFLKKLPSI